MSISYQLSKNILKAGSHTTSTSTARSWGNVILTLQNVQRLKVIYLRITVARKENGQTQFLATNSIPKVTV